MQVLIEHGADVHADDDAALQFACDGGHVNLVKLLIQHGANVQARSNAAVQNIHRNPYVSILQLLIKNGAQMPWLEPRSTAEDGNMTNREPLLWKTNWTLVADCH